MNENFRSKGGGECRANKNIMATVNMNDMNETVMSLVQEWKSDEKFIHGK